MREKERTVPPPKCGQPGTKEAVLPLLERIRREHDAIKRTPDAGLEAIVRITQQIGARRRRANQVPSRPPRPGQSSS
jgi:hypothetical protein